MSDEWLNEQQKMCDEFVSSGGDAALFWAGRMAHFGSQASDAAYKLRIAIDKYNAELISRVPRNMGTT
jgi:hypothetical protein